MIKGFEIGRYSLFSLGANLTVVTSQINHDHHVA